MDNTFLFDFEFNLKLIFVYFENEVKFEHKFIET